MVVHDYNGWRPSSPSQSSSVVDLPYGDGRSKSVPMIAICRSSEEETETLPSYVPSSPYSLSSPRRRQPTPQRSRGSWGSGNGGWLLLVFASISWIAAVFTAMRSRSILRRLTDQHARHRMHLIHAAEQLEKLKYDKQVETALQQKWAKTNAALEHELKIMGQLEQANILMYPLPDNPSPALIKEWLRYREMGLEQQVRSLTNYLQHQSRLAVVERYGAGPHHVKFTVAIDDAVQKSFVVELFPVEIMPHSVHFFLDLVSAKVWDDTVFLYHQDYEHVLATAPIDYYTKKIKFSHLYTLGWASLGFPEYDEKFPHEKYTLGFSGQGPTFFVNTLDNSQFHGIGSQGHHILPQDADPCFGKVIQGQNVIDELVAFGTDINEPGDQKEYKRESNEEVQLKNGGDRDHKWIRIVSVELVP